jgi:hypothetical protein
MKWSQPELIYYPPIARMDLSKARLSYPWAGARKAGALSTGTRSKSITLCETINLLAITHALILTFFTVLWFNLLKSPLQLSKPRATKMYGRVKEELHEFLTSTQDGQLHARDRTGHCADEKNMLLLSGIEPLLSTPQPVILFRQNKRRCLCVLWRGSAIKKRRRKWIKIAAKWKSLRDYVQMINERLARVKPIWNISRISEFIYV